MTLFSVIVPTRNRAATLQVALDSILSQVDADLEIIVVNDGTSAAQAQALETLKSNYGATITFIDLPITQTGHGCFRVMNTGALHSRGDYLCFLDDDDFWTDPHHLRDAGHIVERADAVVDAMFFDQAAYRGETLATGPIWMEDLGARLLAADHADPALSYAVDTNTLLTAHGFAHTNITIVRRGMFEAIGGFDTTLWYEGDRDFFLRLIDAAASIRYQPNIVSRHNIPDRVARTSQSTATSDFDKARDQVRLLHKAVCHARHPELAAYARRHRRYALRKAIVAAATRPALLPKLAALLTSLASRPSKTTQVISSPSINQGLAASR